MDDKILEQLDNKPNRYEIIFYIVMVDPIKDIVHQIFQIMGW